MSAVDEALDILVQEAKGEFFYWHIRGIRFDECNFRFPADLYLGPTITELFERPTALEFAREYVGKNVPLILRGCNLEWPAVTKWNSQYFRYNYM